MDHSLFFKTDASVICFILFVFCILMVILGRFLRNKYFYADLQESKGGVSSLLGALFGLWGFLLAFTFSNSSARFDNVRTIMVDESNIIRNTFLRTETFPDSVGKALRVDLKIYLEARIAYYHDATDLAKLNKAKENARTAGKGLWTKTAQAASLPNMGLVCSNMYNSLTAMFDLAAKRDAILLSGIPELIIYMLLFLALAVSFIGGFTTPVIKTKEWVVVGGFILLACVIIFLTLDLSRPMRGFIKPDAGEERIEKLLELF
jgi:hypothetical protein